MKADVKVLSGVLGATIIAWLLLSFLASQVTPDGFDKAVIWAREILGLAGTLAGFLGLSAAGFTQGLKPEQMAAYSTAGVGGILAGVTLLDIGGWPVPAALAAMAVGTSALRLFKSGGQTG